MKNQQYVKNRIENAKPESIYGRSHFVGSEVYYEGINEIERSMVIAVGGETIALNNGDWCYKWQALDAGKVRP